MKISTKGRYALRLMLDIALNEKEGEPVRIKDIARRQELSCKYLEQIISALHKAGFVRSIRGPQGGYLLTKAPSQYTAGMILRLTEGSLSPVSCLDGEKNRCGRLEECATLLLWQRLNDAINQVVDTVTLQDLIEWHHNRNADNTAEE
ncbi:MAG TPA: Rrf2 family transcriptional regulator [Candidatus Anaerobutyricum avicola]|nr:Rrf2 family transcriptional regulator [Candidatus Anaerobutyricum avicola]